MNEYDKLKPDDSALRLFFKEDTLYLKNEAAKTGPVIPLENPAIPVFEGGRNATLLMIFSHNSGSVLAGDWGTMVSGLIQNERAMNLKLDEVGLINLQQNPALTPESLFAAFPAKKVLVWGKTGEAQLDALPVFGTTELFGKKIFKLNEAATYLNKEAKGELWQFIKGHILE
ncbi:MAG: hypothetical protein ACYC1Q_03675 [Bacteroidia bacterium]